ncbi:MAG: glycosyltransferase, partial [Chitinophagales bacterium]
ADFRDPWTKVDYFDQLKLSKSAAAKHKALEQEVLKNADKVLTVSYAWAEDFRELGTKDVSVITNGYDTADLPKVKPELDSAFSIAHIGNISSERVHEVLFKCLSKLKKENADFAEKFQLKLIGSVESSFMGFLKQYELENNTNHTEAVSHKKAVEETCKAQVLLLLLGSENKSRGRIPLKVFEYLAAQRPIIGIGPKDSDVARIIENSKAGKMLDSNDENTLAELLNSYFEQFQKQNLKVDASGTDQFSRKKLTGDLAKILDGLSKN